MPTIIENIRKAFDALIKFFEPPSAFSWQTLIGLSVFSWAMSYLATDLVENFIANWGWIFLIAGVDWCTRENKLKIGDFLISPWITGALLCVYLFGSWTGGEIPRSAWVAWPIISSIIAAVPAFFENGLRPKIPKPVVRQNLVILFGCNFLASCWIQFHFLTQDWLQQYPSLLQSNFNNSAFVVQLGEPATGRPRGAVVLDLMESALKQQLDNQPWPNVERWLVEKEENVEILKQQAINSLPQVEEDTWWRYTPRVTSNPPGYNLQLAAIWQGPNTESITPFFTKLCQISQVYPQTQASPIPSPSPSPSPTPPTVRPGIGQVNCQPVTSPSPT